jgi:hypothetical protein
MVRFLVVWAFFKAFICGGRMVVLCPCRVTGPGPGEEPAHGGGCGSRSPAWHVSGPSQRLPSREPYLAIFGQLNTATARTIPAITHPIWGTTTVHRSLRYGAQP